MKNYRIIVLLKTGETTSDKEHPLFTKAQTAIKKCAMYLDEQGTDIKTSTIYIHQDNSVVTSQLADGTRCTFSF